MPETYRRHCVIDAPIEDVWSVVSDPKTHPEWWPEVQGVELREHGEYVRLTKRFGFLDLVDNVWVKEPMEHLHEVNFRCTMTGAYTRFSLTPAQDNTFVQIEGGVNPIGWKGRLEKRASPLFFKRWLEAILKALPAAVSGTRQPT